MVNLGLFIIGMGIGIIILGITLFLAQSIFNKDKDEEKDKMED